MIVDVTAPCPDWDTAAAALAQDYTLVEFQGREFYVR